MNRDIRNMPGPGDEETWGPCRNHPNDPRTPDFEGHIEEKQAEMMELRVRTVIDWVIEAFSECEDGKIWEQMRDAFLAEDHAKLGQIAAGVIADYASPTEDEAAEQIAADQEDPRY